MSNIFVLKSKKLQEWGHSIGITKHIFKFGLTSSSIKELIIEYNTTFYAGKDDWSLTLSRSSEITSEVTCVPDPTAVTPNWLNQPGMIGIRTHLSKRMRDRWSSEQQADILWQSCSEYQIPVAVFAGGEISYLESVLKRHPSLSLIIDHFGLGPIDTSIKNGIDYQSFRSMMSLSKYSNVYIKVSTLPVRSSSDYPFTDMHQVVQETIKSFGPERMLWATDFTQSLNRNRSTYIEEVNFWRSGMPFLTQTDIDAILSMNAKKIFPQLNN